MRNRRRRAPAHQPRVGYLEKGPLCQCGRWCCPELGRQMDRSFDRSQRVLNVGQLVVVLLALGAVSVCCIGGLLWVG